MTAIAVAVAVAGSGCAPSASSTNRPTDGPPSLNVSPAASDHPAPRLPVVLESGFSTGGDEAGDIATFGAVLQNPNLDWRVQRMEIFVDFHGPDGAFLAGEEIVVIALPDQTIAIGGQSFGAGSAASMAVVVPDELAALQPAAASGEALEVSDVATTLTGDVWITTGRLTSRFSAELGFVQLTAIHRDASGAIVGGAAGGVLSIGPGATVDFEIVDGAAHGAIAATDVYWQVGS